VPWRWQGKVNEGTFGVVFKAIRASEKSLYEEMVQRNQLFQHYFAIKRPKNNAREGEGFNKDAVREIALLMELKRGTGLSLFLSPCWRAVLEQVSGGARSGTNPDVAVYLAKCIERVF